MEKGIVWMLILDCENNVIGGIIPKHACSEPDTCIYRRLPTGQNIVSDSGVYEIERIMPSYVDNLLFNIPVGEHCREVFLIQLGITGPFSDSPHCSYTPRRFYIKGSQRTVLVPDITYYEILNGSWIAVHPSIIINAIGGIAVVVEDSKGRIVKNAWRNLLYGGEIVSTAWYAADIFLNHFVDLRAKELLRRGVRPAEEAILGLTPGDKYYMVYYRSSFPYLVSFAYFPQIWDMMFKSGCAQRLLNKERAWAITRTGSYGGETAIFCTLLKEGRRFELTPLEEKILLNSEEVVLGERSRVKYGGSDHRFFSLFLDIIASGRHLPQQDLRKILYLLKRKGPDAALDYLIALEV